MGEKLYKSVYYNEDGTIKCAIENNRYSDIIVEIIGILVEIAKGNNYYDVEIEYLDKKRQNIDITITRGYEMCEYINIPNYVDIYDIMRVINGGIV